MLSLTPAYDICPQIRIRSEASQAMFIANHNRSSKLSVCLNAASAFMLSEKDACGIIEHQIKTIMTRWNSVCHLANINEIDKNLLWRRQFLNPYAFQDLNKDRAYLRELLDF